jgi:hypothetical protein
MNKNHFLAFLVLVALTGCIGGGTTETGPTFKGTGLSVSLTVPQETAPSTPVSILAYVKNMASENASEISLYLQGLEGWNVQNPLQTLSLLQPKDTYTFSWLVYSPSTGNKTYKPKIDVFYKMKTVASLKLRIYDNNYLESLPQSKRDEIKKKSALLSFSSSTGTPVSIFTEIKQPFVLAYETQEFPFIINVRNIGNGFVYSPTSDYRFLTVLTANQTVFDASSNYTLSCDVGEHALLQLGNSKAIACKVIAKRSEIANYTDVAVNFTLSYAYLYSVNASIKVK